MSFKTLKKKTRFITLTLMASLILSAIVTLINNNMNKTLADSAISTLARWEFSNSTDNWYYGYSDEIQYGGTNNSSLSNESGMLKASVDFSNNFNDNYSQTALLYTSNDGLNLFGANKASLDFIYDSSLLDGSFLVKLYSDKNVDKLVSIDTSQSTQYAGSLRKVSVEFSFEPIKSACVTNLAIYIIGNKTSYKGDIRIDNVCIYSDCSIN